VAAAAKAASVQLLATDEKTPVLFTLGLAIDAPP